MDNYFSKNLRYLRESKGLSQDALCLEIGCSKSALSQYEMGKSEPTLHVIKEIVRYFGVDFASITDSDLTSTSIVNEPVLKYGSMNEVERLQIENRTLRDALQEIGKGLNKKYKP